MMNQNLNQNVFAAAATTVANMTTTENGHTAASTTGDALLDLYGQVGALRGQDEARIFALFDRAVAEDVLLAAKLLFYTRDARGGVGERDLFRKLAKYAAEKYPELLVNNLELFPEFGRWDDLYALADTQLGKAAFKVLYNQYSHDICRVNTKEPISLVGKWLKSCNASSPETKRLGKLTAKQFGLDEKTYRQGLTMLRNRIRIVETQMSKGEWGKIDYEKLPSKAGLQYREAFKRHDEERYKGYLEAVKNGEKKINAKMNTPQDLVHAYGSRPGGVNGSEDPTIEAMWKNLPDYIHSDENVLCMVDVSGSMYGRPIEVSTGLGMYFAQHNRGAFHNLFMTFESMPRFRKLDDEKSFRENLLDVLNVPWGGSTDLNRACESMLDFAIRNHVPQKDMPTRLIIISDMEIDEATGYWGYNVDFSNILHIDELRQMYERAGYSMPQVIYWNVESRGNHFQTRSDVPGAMLASGSSPAVFEAVMEMKDLEITPYMAMLEVLNGSRYETVTVASRA